MGTVSQFHDRTRPAARRIESEEEAIATARSISAAFAVQSSERDINRILPYAELDALSQSGLTAITVPPEYEGLDVANALLGEIIAIVAEGDSSIAECLELHFRVLEELRTQASEELKSALFARALAGERFTTAAFAAPGTIVASSVGYRLDGRSAPSPGILFADWVAVRAISTEGAAMTLYLPRDTEGLQFVDDWDGFGQRTNGTGTVIASEIPMATESAVIGPQRDPSTASALGALLHAGTDLGIARAALANLHAAPYTSHVGKLAVDVECAAALVERAGGKLDFAQVNPSARAIEIAFFSASAAKITASAAAVETANALFELSSRSATSIGRNLDRHWRNARLRGVGTEADELYRNAAAHHFGRSR
ncbi:monooxygenase [Rhizobium sp. Root1203]|uniref:acyl-CoA dehydrogenase family protein n=1 Tax=Rhizobium sp. Root1203 TaxID=1736427 RepID=UPI00070D06DE|nr:acyl-CoA dehydrogenase family protein [Rhizobium sp. Root1203]KQV10869.1 monooxygenase [Rhizobium sp. Root1203]